MARGVSTVLDVAVCLMLVGAAVATLTAAPPAGESADRPDADRTASLLATVTTSVPIDTDRTAHDTVAGHLATATVADAAISSTRLSETSYPASVRNETTTVTDERVFVTTTWSPYPGSPLNGTVTAGREPPSNAETATTVVEVHSGVAAPTNDSSFTALAAELAAAYIQRLFPPERTDVFLRDGRTATRTANRYRTAASALDTSVEGPLSEPNVSRANAELAAELEKRLADDLERRYGSPSAASEDVRIDRVEVVVRRWEP